MGHDGATEVGGSLKVVVNKDSARFKDKIKKGIIDTSLLGIVVSIKSTGL